MKEQMLAAVYHGPQDIRIETRPIPQIGDREALVKVLSTGICGTDIRIYRGNHRKFSSGVTRILGHEVVGEIAAVGSQIKQFDIGKRYFVAPNIGCGSCKQCISGKNNLCLDYEAIGITLDGSFAEYMRIPESAILQGNLIPVGNHVNSSIATIIEPFACVVHGQEKLSIQPGENVLIIGAGPIGIMHAILARFSGAGTVLISETNPQRLSQASKFNIDQTINAVDDDLFEITKKTTKGKGIDIVIVAAPSIIAQQQALELVNIGGRINFFGGLPKGNSTVKIDSNLIHYKELVVTGTTGCSTFDCYKAAQIINSKDINMSGLISDKYSLSETLQAIGLVEKGKALKVILEP